MQSVMINKEYKKMKYKEKRKLFIYLALPVITIFLFFFSLALLKWVAVFIAAIACFILIQEVFFVLLGLVSLISILYFIVQVFS
ncbi:hypothetical protein ACFVL4_13765 [Bacillus subtilis]|nr:hypothetical protein [Bacillus subtilis]MEC3665053.1 hypothetical protein [Bacillus subtilis]ODV48086.1 hypothetical protein BCM26_03825 [Bacillus subtilis]OJH64031.1 hypothetical protein BOH71_06755 [Bacillus subtilis]RPJ98068.1 hypothetical protein EH11_04148 [Bacillus subtilis]GLI90662.1 hypothetical protein ANABIO4_40140 [Bacillus subtilis]